MKKSSEQSPFPPLIALFFAILAVSTAAIFIRFAQSDAPSLVIAAYRLSLASLILFPFAWKFARTEIRLLTSGQIGLAVVSGIFLAIHFGSWISSLQFTTVASSLVLVSTSPLWVALISVMFLNERIQNNMILGMAIALLGGTMVGLSDTCIFQSGILVCPPLNGFFAGPAVWGDFLALIGALAAAGYLLIGRKLRQTISLISYTFLVYGIAAIFLVGSVIVFGYQPFGYLPTTYLWFLLLALIPQLIGHSTFNWSLRYISAAFVSIALLGEPIGSTILAFIILGEIPTPIKMVGAILILIGIYVSIRTNK